MNFKKCVQSFNRSSDIVFSRKVCVAHLELDFSITKFAADDFYASYYLNAHTNKGGDLVGMHFNDIKKAEEQMILLSNFIQHVSEADEYSVETTLKSYKVQIERKEETVDEIPF